MIPKITQFHGAHATGSDGSVDGDVYLRFVDDLDLSGDRDKLTKLAADTKYTPDTELFILERLPRIRRKGMIYLLDNALGAGEAWSSNVNGDWFGERMLLEKHPTFVTMGNPFLHHQNKDPRLSKGRIVYSAYNPRMRRVELVVELDPNKAREVVDAIERGEFPRTSMGFRAEFDTCSICGNVARTRGQYCKHLLSQMNDILPDGRKVCAHNTKGHFFDHSYVRVPADKTAGTLVFIKAASVDEPASMLLRENISSALVAEACGYTTSSPLEKVASVATEEEMAPIQFGFAFGDSSDPKNDLAADVVVGEVLPKLASGEVSFDNETLDKLASAGPLMEILGTLGLLGVSLKPHEFQRVTLKHYGEGEKAEELSDACRCFEPRGDDASPVTGMSFKPEHVSDKVYLVIRTKLKDRSSDALQMLRRVLTPSEEPETKPLLKKEAKIQETLAKLYESYRCGLGETPVGVVKQAAHQNPYVFQGVDVDACWSTLARCKNLGMDGLSKQASASHRVSALLSSNEQLRDRVVELASPSGREANARSFIKTAQDRALVGEIAEGLSLDTIESMLVECAL